MSNPEVFASNSTVPSACWDCASWAAGKLSEGVMFGGKTIVSYVGAGIDSLPPLGKVIVDVARRIPSPEVLASGGVVVAEFGGALYCVHQAWENFGLRSRSVTTITNGDTVVRQVEAPRIKMVPVYLAGAAFLSYMAIHEVQSGILCS